MKIASTLFAILGCSVSTIVSVWLLGSLVAWAADAAGPIGREVLVQMSTPWLGGKPHPADVSGQSAERPAFVVVKSSR